MDTVPLSTGVIRAENGTQQTAHETVLRHSRSTAPFHVSRVTDDVRPWADAYVKILRTVMHFAMLFSESALQREPVPRPLLLCVRAAEH